MSVCVSVCLLFVFFCFVLLPGSHFAFCRPLSFGERAQSPMPFDCPAVGGLLFAWQLPVCKGACCLLSAWINSSGFVLGQFEGRHFICRALHLWACAECGLFTKKAHCVGWLIVWLWGACWLADCPDVGLLCLYVCPLPFFLFCLFFLPGSHFAVCRPLSFGERAQSRMPFDCPAVGGLLFA